MYRSWQKLIAEFIGTFLFVLTASGCICADQALHAEGQTGIGLVGIALAQGLAYAIIVSAIGHISGGHINPAVTIGFWVTRKMNTLLALGYWIAQLLGSISAAYVLFKLLPPSVWGPVALGTPDLAPEFTRMHGMALEFLMTFFLVFVFFATAADAKGAFHKVAGSAIGLTIAVDVLIGWPFTGASMNPARSLGPALVSSHWANHGVYWAGPLLGGVVAAWIYDTIFLREA
jgi:MIP family channel proteins